MKDTWICDKQRVQSVEEECSKQRVGGEAPWWKAAWIVGSSVRGPLCGGQRGSGLSPGWRV